MGSSSKDSVNIFLEKVELFREARVMSKTEWFQSACNLFRGLARTWLVNNRSWVENWDEWVQKLKHDFLPYFYDEHELEIQSRTQGEIERVVLFISSMGDCLVGYRLKLLKFHNPHKFHDFRREYVIWKNSLWMWLLWHRQNVGIVKC